MPLHRGSRQLASSLTWKRPMKQPIWHHWRPSQDWPQRLTACFCVRISKEPQNQSQNWDHTLWWILPRRRCSNWWCPCCYMLWSKDQWAALMYCKGHLQSTVRGWPRNLFSWALAGHHRETFTEANCLFSCQNISGTGGSESELGQHSLTNSTQRKVFQLAVTCFGLKINELPSCIARDIFKALFVDDLAICFRGRSLDTIERHLQQAVNAIQEWATRNGFRFAAHKCKVMHFTAPRSRAQRPPIVRIGNTLLPVEESTKFLRLWWDSHLSFKKHISVLKTQCKEALNLIRVVAHLKWGGDRDTLLMLYRAIVRSKFDYGCIVYGTASNTNLRQLDSIHNSGLRLALGAFCTSPMSSLYTEANEAPLEERRLKLSMHYYVKTLACIDNPAHHALHKFDRTTWDLYAPRPNGRGGMTRPPAPPIGLKIEEAMTSAEINAELVCPLRTPNFPPGTHDYDPKRYDLIEGVSKSMISRQEAQAKFNEFLEAQGSHDEVYTDGSKMNERVGAAAIINHHFQNGETTCRQLSKRLPDNSTIFAAEAIAISLALNYYQHMGTVHHDVVVYSDSMSCLQAIEGEDTENPFICHIMNLLWSLSDKGTRVRFCWVPSHCGIDGNERVDQLAKETLDQDIDPLASVHYTDMKPLVIFYIQKLVQTKWDVAVHGRDLYILKPTPGPPKKFQHLTRAEEVVITRLRIGHTKTTKSHILSRGPPTGCLHCGETLTIDHMLLECALLRECRDEYYTVDSLNALFETIPETCLVEFLREAGFFYLIWCNFNFN